MKVRILEKIYHPTNNPNLSTPFRRKREEHWIRRLGTAVPYSCNDHIDSTGNLTSHGCQSVNVLNLFDRTSRRHRSHGTRKYNKPEIHNVSFAGLLPFVNLQLGLLFFCWYRGFCHRTGSDLLLFLFIIFVRDCTLFP